MSSRIFISIALLVFDTGSLLADTDIGSELNLLNRVSFTRNGQFLMPGKVLGSCTVIGTPRCGLRLS